MWPHFQYASNKGQTKTIKCFYSSLTKQSPISRLTQQIFEQLKWLKLWSNLFQSMPPCIGSTNITYTNAKLQFLHHSYSCLKPGKKKTISLKTGGSNQQSPTLTWSKTSCAQMISQCVLLNFATSKYFVLVWRNLKTSAAARIYIRTADDLCMVQ